MPEDVAAVAELPAGQAGESLSCVTCRSRKLRCDKTKPVCTRCAKSNGNCVYPESRRKPTFKRKNVKELEERLAQVEGLLRQASEGQLVTAGIGAGPASGSSSGAGVNVGIGEFTTEAVQNDTFEVPTTEDVLFEGIDYGTPNIAPDDPIFAFNQDNPTAFTGNNPSAQPVDDFTSNSFNSELIDLGGVFEALPPFEVMEDLNRLFFERQQQFAPIIHPGRYMQAFYSAPHMKPPMCLQYAIWALTSNNDPKYHIYHDIFYRRARQYAEFDEMKGHGEHFITVAHAQTWCVLATDEAKSTMFTRAAMSCARAVRLAAMMGLHHLDSPPDESSPTLVPPRDWLELEERRRVFWGIFCIDSHCSISTGWPHLIDMNEVTTRLPASEAAFHSGEPMETCSIHDVFRGEHSYSSFAGSVVVCHLFNQILKHAHRPKANDNPEDFEYGAYWKRHRDLDNTLSGAFMFLPESFRLPENYRELTAINTNLNLHASIICLHHAAIERIEANNLPDSAKKMSQDRLGAAAQEIINILKLTSHLGSSPRTPLAALSLFCAASVYIYFCQENQAPTHVDNLDFILSAMEAIGRTHSITRSFLRQALLDIEHNGILDMVRIPSAERLIRRLTNNAVPHNVPLLARTRLSRHSEAQPPLPGLLLSRSSSYNTPYRYDTWRQPSRNHQTAASSTLDSCSSSAGGHIHKRKRTTTPSTNSSPQNDTDVPIQPSIPFNYLPIRSDSQTTTSPYSTSTPATTTAAAAAARIPSSRTSTDAESCRSNNFHQQDTTTTTSNYLNQNRVDVGMGVTILPGLLGNNNGANPFHNTTPATTTTGLREPQTQAQAGASNGGVGGSWNQNHPAGICASATSADQTRSTSNNSSANGSGAAAGVVIDVIENNPFQFLDPRNVNIDWDAIDTGLGVGTPTSTRHACGGGDGGDAGDEMNRFADTGGG